MSLLSTFPQLLQYDWLVPLVKLPTGDLPQSTSHTVLPVRYKYTSCYLTVYIHVKCTTMLEKLSLFSSLGKVLALSIHIKAVSFRCIQIKSWNVGSLIFEEKRTTENARDVS